MIGFDIKLELRKENRGLFRVPQSFIEGIERRGKGTLHIHMIVFLAGFLQDSNEMVKMRLKMSLLKIV